MSDEAHFEMFRSFAVDDGQLDGMTPQVCFVLGYELALFDGWLSDPNGRKEMVHSANRERMQAWADKQNRRIVLAWMQGDSSEDWMALTIEPKAFP